MDTRQSRRGKKWTDEEQENMIELAKMGTSLSDIAVHIKRTLFAIRCKMAEIILANDKEFDLDDMCSDHGIEVEFVKVFRDFQAWRIAGQEGI
jgi:hypothetical protein